MKIGTVSCGVPIFVWGAYKQDVVIVIKISAYIHGGLFYMGTYYPDLWYLLFMRDVAVQNAEKYSRCFKLYSDFG